MCDVNGAAGCHNPECLDRRYGPGRRPERVSDHGQGRETYRMRQGQPPTLTEVTGDGITDPTVWDARTELALGTLIRRLLADDPPPADSLFAPDLELWAERLLADGRARLEDAGERFLRAVG